MQDAVSRAQQVLSYWYDCFAQRAVLNTPHLSKSALEPLDCQAADCQAGIFSMKGIIRGGNAEKYAMWVAPIVFANTKNNSDYCVPLWLPIQLSPTGEVSIPEHILPWIPPVLCDPCSDGPYLGPMMQLEKRYLETAEDLQHRTDWTSFLAWGKDLLAALSGQENFVPPGYKQLKTSWLLRPGSGMRLSSSLSRVLSQVVQQKSLPSLVNRYAALTPAVMHPQRSPEALVQTAQEHSGQIAGSLNPGQRTALMHSLLLEEGELQAIVTPQGTQQASVVQSYAASTMVTAALKGQSPPILVLVTPDQKGKETYRASLEGIVERWLPDNPKLIADVKECLCLENEAYLLRAEQYFLQACCEAFSATFTTVDQALERVHQELSATQQLLSDGVGRVQQILALRERLDAKYEDEGGLDAQWEALQANDKSLEKEYSELAQAALAWEQAQPKGLFEPISRRLPVLRTRLRDKIWTFFEQNLKGRVPWDENGFDFGRTLSATLHARMRTLQGQRAKLHTALVPVSEAIAQRGMAESQWNAWQIEFAPLEPAPVLSAFLKADPEELLSHLDRSLRQKSYRLAVHYWEAMWLKSTAQRLSIAPGQDVRQKLQGAMERQAMLHHVVIATRAEAVHRWSYTNIAGEKSPLENNIDMLFLHDSNAYLPMEPVDLLLRSKRAVFFGDKLREKPMPPVTRYEDEQLASQYHLAEDEMAFDELYAKGLLASTGNALQLARTQSAFKREQQFGLSAETDLMLHTVFSASNGLVDYLNKTTYGNKLLCPIQAKEHPFPAFAAVHIKGQSAGKNMQRHNLREVTGVARWLELNKRKILNHYTAYSSLSECVCVLTPFLAQREQLQAALGEVPVYVSQSPPAKRYPIVLFSPTYTLDDARPFILDQDEYLLPAQVATAMDSFILIGDLESFDPSTHSPSGKLAQSLLQAPPLALPWIPLSDLPSEVMEWQDLKQYRSRLIESFQKATKELIIMSPNLDPETLASLRLSQEIHKAVSRGVQVHIVTTQNVVQSHAKEKSVEAWMRAGIHLWSMPCLQTCLFSVDGTEAFIVPFDLLACKERDFSATVQLYPGEAAQKLLAIFWGPIRGRAQLKRAKAKSVAVPS